VGIQTFNEVLRKEFLSEKEEYTDKEQDIIFLIDNLQELASDLNFKETTLKVCTLHNINVQIPQHNRQRIFLTNKIIDQTGLNENINYDLEFFIPNDRIDEAIEMNQNIFFREGLSIRKYNDRANSRFEIYLNKKDLITPGIYSINFYLGIGD
jgi:hypothetical protein